MISLVVARDRDGAIGRNNEIPWRAPEDLARFQREPLGGAIIMGRRTWQSLPKRPLEGRLNCVVSRDRSVAEVVFASVAAALRGCREAGYHRLYGIGGESIFAEMLPFADRLLITEVDVRVDGPDAWFPGFDPDGWQEVDRRVIRSAPPKCTVRELLRIGSPLERLAGWSGQLAGAA